jgi:hypothetical protein
MPKEKKYVKLEAGERKAVRKSGAMKTARTTGLKTNIYSGEKGGLFTSTGPKSTVPGATTRTKSTPSVDVKRQSASTESKEYNNAQYIQQGMINQKEFEKTRLGARVVRKADKAVAKIEKKGGEVSGSRYTQGAPKSTSAKKQIKVAGVSKQSPGYGLNKRGYSNMTSEQKAAAKKTVAEKKKEESYTKKRERAASKTERQSARNEAAGMRKDARIAKRNS